MPKLAGEGGVKLPERVMNCRELRELLLLHAGGKEALPAALSTHLSECSPCRREWRSYASVWELLEESGSLEPDASFEEGVRRRLGRRGGWRVLIPLGTAAAALIGLVLSLPGTHDSGVSGDPLTSEEKEILENLELLENYDLIHAMEVAGAGAEDLLPGEDE